MIDLGLIGAVAAAGAEAGGGADCEAQDGTIGFTKLLIHSDDTDGVTTFTDSSPSGHTLTAINDTQHDTAQSKFGVSGILFDGSGDELYVSAGNATDILLGGGDWTMDFWVRFNSLSAAAVILAMWQGTNQFLLQFPSATQMRMTIVGGFDKFQTVSTISTGVWYHFAVVRASDTVRFFMDGVEQGGGASCTVTTTDASSELAIGSQHGLKILDGWLDEVRIVIGEAKWTTDFTPPIKPYCDAS